MQSFLSAYRQVVSLLPLTLLSCICCLSAAAQRAPVQFRTQSISVFGGYVYDNIGFRPGSASGGSGGFDLTQYFLRVPLAVSLEARANVAYGIQADEHSYVFGPRVAYGFGRYHPYVDFQLGLGNIHFGPALRFDQDEYGDKSAVVAGGGGVDIDLIRNVAARVDFQAQHWDIDPLLHETFVPTLVTLGITYTIPFRALHRSGDPHY